ncbi:MAG TPA: tetratricopeptide repeat protein, partial [Vicinamibacterales bacterium]|nr:tetratricopeptide repeat protein [Vicinamibacterales bacterium]
MSRKRRQPPKPAPVRPEKPSTIPIAAGLAVAVAIIYAQTAGFAFLNFDDDAYVTRNPAVQNGLGWSGLTWAFTTFQYFYWHPITWLSHMLDCQLFGLNPGEAHVVNALIHGLNAVLLFTLLRRMTGTKWPSAAAAGLFAVHPLRVESVAWIAERKDVLSGLFWIVSIRAYASYCANRSPRRMALVAIAMTLGLMSKPTVVTLPIVLLAIDAWPLARTESMMARVREKAPLFVLSAGAALLTYVGQRRMGATEVVSNLSPSNRAANALVSYGAYLRLTAWPAKLAILYPYRTDLPLWKPLAAAALMAAITAVAIWQRRRRPYLLTGWIWFVVVLAPAIGLIQVGAQSMADRFTYIPHMGLMIAVAWTAAEWAPRRAIVPLAAAVLIGLTAASAIQASYWRDSVAVFGHAVAVTGANTIAERNLGAAYAAAGNTADAIRHFRASLSLDPAQFETRYELGSALMASGDFRGAREEFRESARLNEDYASPHFALALVDVHEGALADAETEYRRALRLNLG